MADRAAYPNMSEHMLEQVCDENGVWYYPQHGNGIYNEVSEIAELVTGGGTGSASAAWRAYDAAGTPGYLRDATGNGHTAALGATPRATLTGEALQLPGTSGNYASVPDEAALDITGDIDIRCAAALNDWTPGANNALVAKYGGTSAVQSYLLRANLTTGYLAFFWRNSSTTSLSATSTVAPTVTDGSLLLVRATLDVDNGASGYDVKFYTKASTPSSASADLAADTGWTQLGATVTTAGVTDIQSTTASVESGAWGVGTQDPAAGRIYAAVIKDGIDGTTVLAVDFTGNTGATSFTCDTGQTVTINRSAAGTDVPKFLEHDGEDYVWLPGTSGNYVELAPDVNLLDTNTGHLQAPVYWAAVASTTIDLTSNGFEPFGFPSMQVEFDSAGPASSRLQSPSLSYISCTPGQVYTFSWHQNIEGQCIRPNTWTFNGTGNAAAINNHARVEVSPGVWRGSCDVTIPSGATSFDLIRLYRDVLDTPFQVGAFCLRLGTTKTFVPSTRVTGDLDVRAKIDAAALPASRFSIVSNHNVSGTFRGFDFQLNTDGALWFLWGDGTAQRIALGLPGAFDPVATPWVRVTKNATTINFYKSANGTDWTLNVSRAHTFPTTAIPVQPLCVGQRPESTPFSMLGSVYSAEVRDGIDGPVVASFNANAITEPHTTFVTPEGHTATLKRSASGLVTAVVDRSLFVLDGSNDYFNVPDHADLEPVAGEHSTVVIVFRSNLNGQTQGLLHKKVGSATNAGLGWTLYKQTNDFGYYNYNDGTTNRFAIGNTLLTRFTTISLAGVRYSDSMLVVTNGASYGSPTATDTPTSVTTEPLRIGTTNFSQFAAMEFIGAAVFKGTALTDAQIAAVAKYLGAER